MANNAAKTEHSGAKHGNGAFWGRKVDAKAQSNSLRRANDRKAAQDFVAAHAEGFHDDFAREFCPGCDR